jgi:hypothetical protein
MYSSYHIVRKNPLQFSFNNSNICRRSTHFAIFARPIVILLRTTNKLQVLPDVFDPFSIGLRCGLWDSVTRFSTFKQYPLGPWFTGYKSHFWILLRKGGLLHHLNMRATTNLLLAHGSSSQCGFSCEFAGSQCVGMRLAKDISPTTGLSFSQCGFSWKSDGSHCVGMRLAKDISPTTGLSSSQCVFFLEIGWQLLCWYAVGQGYSSPHRAKLLSMRIFLEIGWQLLCWYAVGQGYIIHHRAQLLPMRIFLENRMAVIVLVCGWPRI